MTDIDRYITDEVVERAARVLLDSSLPGHTYTGIGPVLRAVLPDMLAQHEKDVRVKVLREAAEVDESNQGDFYEDDEPIEKIRAIWEKGPHGRTSPHP